MTINDFDALFLQEKASVFVSNTEQRTFVAKYYEDRYGFIVHKYEHNFDFPWIVLEGNLVVGWRGGDERWNEIPIQFQDFYAMVNNLEHCEEIGSVEELL